MRAGAGKGRAAPARLPHEVWVLFPECWKAMVKDEERVSYSLLYDYKRPSCCQVVRGSSINRDQQEADLVRDDNGLTHDVSKGMGAVDS